MSKYDVRRQTDSRIEKVLGVYSRAGHPFPSQHLGWLRTHVDSYGYGKFRTDVAVQALITYTKENNMTPLQVATNKRDVLVAERDKNRATVAEFREATITLSQRNAVINTEVLNLNTTIAVEQAKEREAKHKAMADELRQAGYRVENTVTLYGAQLDTASIIAAMQTAYGAGPARQSRPTPQAKLGVHGVGEGWYSPVVYDSQGVKLEHDFAINTRDHHEARNQWWLKHLPSGRITKGFPNEAEVHRWIRARTHRPIADSAMSPQWYAGLYQDYK